MSTVSNPTIPYIGPLPSRLQPGNLIRISGVPSISATCFSVNLQTGSNGTQRSDIALHLSPVFTPPPRLVRNSLENQNWGPEESHGPYFPFSSGQAFEILILAEADQFKIAVNGQHFTEFHYRLPLSIISHITIDGDVTINSINFDGFIKSPMNPGNGEDIVKPLGFVIEPNAQSNLMPTSPSGRPPSPYEASSLPYPANPSFIPTAANYPSPTSPSGNTYGPPSSYNPYGPPPQSGAYPSGRVSPLPPGGGYPYGPPPGGYPHSAQGYPQQPGTYPSQGYPQQPGAYPSQGYPSPAGPYPGTTVVYPGQEKKSDSGMNLGPMAAAAGAAIAGVAGSALLHGGKHKKHKHGHGMMGGYGPGSSLLGGVGSLLSGNKHGRAGSSPIPIGGAVAGGAAALAGAYMINKVVKPKKMKKLYKHKHKSWGGFGSSSSSSSSSDEE